MLLEEITTSYPLRSKVSKNNCAKNLKGDNKALKPGTFCPQLVLISQVFNLCQWLPNFFLSKNAVYTGASGYISCKASSTLSAPPYSIKKSCAKATFIEMSPAPSVQNCHWVVF